MEFINTANATEGQTIARAIKNDAGAVLCPAGLQLTSDIIRKLKQAGIDQILIEGGENKGPSIDDRLAALQARFASVDDPIMLQLKAVIEKRLNLLRLA